MRENFLRCTVFASMVLVALAACDVNAGNLIVNGGFVGGTTGWTVSGASVGANDYNGADRASDGDGWYATMGNGSSAPDGIFYQQVAVTAGKLHALSVDYRRQGYSTESLTIDVFDGAVDGANLTSNPIASGDLFGNTVVVNESRGYQEESGTFTPTGSTVTFRLSDIGAAASLNTGYWADNVQLVETYVPTPFTPVTFDAVADAEIDQHVNYNGSNIGFETSIRVETRSTAYTNPVVSPQSWALMKWNLSSIDPGTVLDDASLRIIQVDGAVDTVDVYGIEVGDWDEATVSWANWVGTETVSFLGTMTNTPISVDGGVTTFSSSALTASVQDWIDGDQENYGLLLKWSGAVGEGDTYASREHASLDPPQLIISSVPEPGTIALLLGGLCFVLFARKRR